MIKNDCSYKEKWKVKKSLLKLLALCLCVCAGVFLFTACDNGDNPSVKDISFTTLTVVGTEVNGDVDYDVYEFSFVNEVTKSGDISYKVSKDRYGLEIFTSKIVPLEEGDNLFYVFVFDGDDILKTYNVNINRKTGPFIVSNNTITGLTDDGKALTRIYIPSTVNGVEITSIGDYAFMNCGNLLSVTIENKITHIGCNAFWGCYSLTRIVIPSSITTIDSYAFANCFKLVEVINNSGLTITKGSLDDGLIGAYALYIHKGESKIVNQNDYLFITAENGTNYLFSYVGSDTQLTLPKDYNGENYEIRHHAFYCCSSLTSVTIPDSVTSIGYWAFLGCAGLTSITIPNSVTSIGDRAFYDCSSLTSITIGNSVTSIGDYAFQNCSSLTSVTIPDSVTSIGRYTFSRCSSLTSLTFSDTTTWYITTNYTNWRNKTEGTETDVTSPFTNATYFKSTYYDYYWYKK